MSLEGVLRDGNLTDKTTLSESELESAATYLLLLILGCVCGTAAAALFSPCVFFWRRREDLSPDGWESPSDLAILFDFTTDKCLRLIRGGRICVWNVRAWVRFRWVLFDIFLNHSSLYRTIYSRHSFLQKRPDL